MINGVLSSILDTIGNTPMVNLSKMTKGLEGQIFAKVEFFNPGASKKDRIALQIIEDAEKSGKLKKGQTVVELTSGSTGIGLAVVCAVKGYPFVPVMSKGNSIERAIMMKALGAKLVLVNQMPNSTPGQVSGEDLNLVEQETQRLVKELNAFRPDQFNNTSNLSAYELHVGEEIWQQTDGKVDVFVDFVGTGGSFAGCMKALKKHNPDIRGYMVEPTNAAFYSSGSLSNPNHKIQGGGYCMDLPLVDKSLVEGYISISDEESIETTRRLASTEGIFAGYSSGANIAAALKLLKEKEKGKNICLLINDTGLKYMSNDLFEKI